MNGKMVNRQKELDIKSMYRVIKKRIWILATISFLAAICGIFYAKYFNPPLYQSSTRIILKADAQTMSTLKVIIKEPVILEKVIDQLNINKSPETLRGQISVNNVEGSQVVTISVVDHDSQLAALIANSTVKVYKKEIINLFNIGDVTTILSEAKENPWPINQNSTKIIVISLFIGIIMSIGLILLLDSLDDTLKEERDVENLLGLPVLGTVSRITKRNTILKNKTKQKSIPLRGESIGS